MRNYKRLRFQGDDEPGRCPICDGVGQTLRRNDYTGEHESGSCWACDGTGLNKRAREEACLERAEREKARIDKAMGFGADQQVHDQSS